MGRGKRFTVRSLRLPDLWKGRRTSFPSLPPSADSDHSLASLIHDSSSNNYVSSSSSSSTVGQPAFNVTQGSSDGFIPTSFPSALHANNNLRQQAPALAPPDLKVMVPPLFCRHSQPFALSTPNPPPTPGSATRPSIPIATITTQHPTSATTSGHPYQGVTPSVISPQETIVRIAPEPPPSDPTFSAPSNYAVSDSHTANLLPDPLPARPWAPTAEDVSGPHTNLTVPGTPDWGAASPAPRHVVQAASRTLEPSSVVLRTPVLGPDTPPISPPRGRQGRASDSPHQRILRGPPSPAPSLPPVVQQLAPALPPRMLPSHRKRSLTLHDYWCPDRPTPTRPGPSHLCSCPPASPGDRRHSDGPLDADRPRKTARASRPASPDPTRALLGPPAPLPPSHQPTPLTLSPEVQFLGPIPPAVLQAVSPSGDVRLTLRRYAPTDTITSAHLRFRLDLRILPRDLYSIPSDGHCGYHSLAVLSHPQFPSPPSAQERHDLRSELLLRLLHLPEPALRAAATAGQHHPPPRLLPRQHWLNAAWLHLIPDLPPIGCLALLSDTDPSSANQWYHCTALSCAPTQLEHSWSDLLRVADSGRLLLHTHAHFFPVTPPAFLSLAIRQCGDLLQLRLGSPTSLDPPQLPVEPRPPPPTIRRYTSLRAHPGGIQLGLGPSALSSDAQWGVFTLKTISSGTRILEYGGQRRTQAWLDTPGQNLTYVWSDLDNHAFLAKSGQLPVIIDAHPAHTDSWGGRINDGLVHGANVEIRRDKHSDKAYIWAIETITPGTELTVHYGPDYWQEHYFHCPQPVQQEAALCYALIVIEGKCYQTKELRKLRADGGAHQIRGQWFLGPRCRPPPESVARRRGPARPPLRTLLPLPQGEPSAQPGPPSPPHLDQRPPSPPPPTLLLPLAPPPCPETAPSSPGAHMDSPPFLWLMDLTGSIIDHSLQATWGVTALAAVATFLHDPLHCNMESLLPWASAYGSPARFTLLHASPTAPPLSSDVSPLETLAADYGLKARSASGIRGDDLEDWPCLSDPEERSLVLSHFTRLLTLSTLSPAATALVTAGISPDPPVTTWRPDESQLLDLGDPRLPYSLFTPLPAPTMERLGCLPLHLVGDPRLPRTRDHAWTDLLMIGSHPNFATLDPNGHLTPLSSPLPHRTAEQIRWALHSLCQATIEAVALPPIRLRRPTRRPLPPPPPPHYCRSRGGAPDGSPGASLAAHVGPAHGPPGPSRCTSSCPLPITLGYSLDLPLDCTPSNGHLRYLVEFVTTRASSCCPLRVHHFPHPKSTYRLPEHQRAYTTETDGTAMVHAPRTAGCFLSPGYQDPAPYGQIPGPPSKGIHGAR